jgi:hypothetical protein
MTPTTPQCSAASFSHRWVVLLKNEMLLSHGLCSSSIHRHVPKVCGVGGVLADLLMLGSLRCHEKQSTGVKGFVDVLNVTTSLTK